MMLFIVLVKCYKSNHKLNYYYNNNNNTR